MRVVSKGKLSAVLMIALWATACGGSSTSPSSTPSTIPGLVGTGVSVTSGLDTVWEVECIPLIANTPACPAAGFQRAARINSTGFGWVAPPTGGAWIGATDSASLPAGASDNAARYQYVYRMQFDLTGYDPATARISLEWSADNYFGGYRFNTSSFVGGSSADQQWLSFKTLNLQAPTDTFSAGRNLLELLVTGDGVTDGFVIRNFSGTAQKK